jgi:hypothetical protein
MGLSNDTFIKYPRTPHLSGSRGTDDDKHLGQAESAALGAERKASSAGSDSGDREANRQAGAADTDRESCINLCREFGTGVTISVPELSRCKE